MTFIIVGFSDFWKVLYAIHASSDKLCEED